jgi:acetylornithine deacetylase/succinyl-diaminopimelate desuccinylase-like protein
MALGDPDFTPNERKGARPTFEINGMWSGYTGAGSKTIIPATAHAKITCRLVPHMEPAKVGEAVKAHLLKHAPAGVAIDVEVRRGSPASLVDRDSSQVQAAVKAAQDTYGNAPYFELEGGSPWCTISSRNCRSRWCCWAWACRMTPFTPPMSAMRSSAMRKASRRAFAS